MARSTMAPRDRNLFAWQVYVITMSFVSLLLLVGVFLLWKSYSDATKIKDDLATQLRTSKDETDKGIKRVKLVKSMLGYGTESADDIKFLIDSLKDDAEVGEVLKNYPTDMAVFDPNVEKKDYRQFPIYLLDTIRERNVQIDRARQIEQKLTREKAEVVERETKAREQAVKEKNDAEAQLAAARDQHTQNIAKLNSEKDQITAQITKFKQDAEVKTNALQAEQTRLLAETKTQRATIDSQLERIKLAIDQEFEEPAGEVINVDNGGRTVWINIGFDDGLREGVTFAVLDESTLNVADAKIKAEMVVERVTDAHMAQARVVTPNYTRPVLPRDLVYSPAWRKGRTQGFALVGLMDIDNDGRDDRDMIKSVIERAGGRVDAELLPNGNVEPKGNVPGKGMNVNTQFLVIGTDVSITDKANLEQQEKAKRYSKFIGEAKSLGIQQMNMSRLLGFLKSKNSNRTVPLGSQTRATDFEPKSASGVIPETQGVVSELFRQRKPVGK
jgi:hypothetical protein